MTTVSNGQIVFVTTGQTVSGLVVLSGGAVDVLGGTISGTILSGGNAIIASGHSFGTTIRGGAEQVNSGASASGTTISSGGQEIVNSGGRASGTVVSGGYLHVASGGTASAGVVQSGGSAGIDKGGNASGTVVSSGGSISLFLSSGTVGAPVAGQTVIEGVTIDDGAFLTLEIGSGTSTSGLLVSGTPLPGLLASVEYVDSGATATSTTIVDGGWMFVHAGGVASGTIVGSGGSLEVDAGGAATSSIIESGGYVTAAGNISGTIVGSGGAITFGLSAGHSVDALAAEAGVTVQDGALVDISVLSGAATVGFAISSGVFDSIQSGGTATSTIVGSGGDLEVNGGGVARGTTIEAGGLMEVFNFFPAFGGNAIASGTVVSSGGIESVLGGGLESGATVDTGGQLLLSGGGVSISAALAGGTEIVSSGSIASNTVVLTGGRLVVSSSGQTSGATVIAGGTLVLNAGAVAGGTLDFTGSGGLLQIEGSKTPSTVVSGFAPGDTIGLHGFAFSSVGTAKLGAGNVLHVVENGASGDLHFDAAQNFAGYSFRAVDDGGFTDIVLNSFPTIAAPAAVTLTAASAGPIGTISIAEIGDTADETFAVSVSDLHGLLSATGSGVSGSGTTKVTITGSLTQINGALATLTDIEAVAGSDSILVTVSDSLGGSAGAKTIAISVVSPAESWHGPSAKNRSGDFNAGTNWSTGFVPDSGTAVTLGTTSSYVVTSAEDNAVASLVIADAQANLDIAAGTFRILGAGPRKNAGTITVADGATLALSGTITNNGTIALNSVGNATRLVLDGNVVLNGTGALTLDDAELNEIVTDGSAQQLVNNSTIVGRALIGDGGYKLSLVNNGTIDAIASNAFHALEIFAGSAVNHGTMEATGSGWFIVHGDLVNSGGTLVADDGKVDINGALLGSGDATIADGGRLAIEGKVAATQTVSFGSGGGLLTLALAQKFAGTVAGLAQGDAIDLQNFAFSQTAMAAVTGTGDIGTNTVVTVQTAARTANIALLNQYAGEFAADAGAYQLVSDHFGTRPGTLLELASPSPV